ncbi:hypothetical protein Sp245p_26290 (plasmid) [Azospirillum baldaniorum]|uniref:Uncharacterized protein n=1 Tax=Azospirillum baldaniorum TaxID=1064539 RepID=A0A9P1JZU6_9PROT|nr:hypothetical protein [Azospirillum baldaniorum]AWJ93333.1 hypothetical protein Sp245p_26290 [Azospirillum baldaniorum]TWA78036.1 hypothetical protein FBZ85_106196 [Azospirillum brasilense]CCD02862.1 conserved protein of unknown function [Azospirillum baldaniorum]
MRIGSSILRSPRPDTNLQFLSGLLDPRVSSWTRSGVCSYWDAAGALQAPGANVARFDHAPLTLNPLGLLFEEARANLIASPDTPATQSVSVTAQAYTLSFYGSGTVTLSGTATATVAGTGVVPNRRTYTFTPTAGTLTLTISGTVRYANLEAGAYATSYIPGASRGADTGITLAASTLPGLSVSQGTLFVEWLFPGILPSGQVSFIGFDDGTGTNRILLRVGQGGVADMVSSPGGIDTSGFAVTAGTIIRQAVAWSSGSWGHAVNGQLETSSVTTMPASFTRLLLGAGLGSYWLSKVRHYAIRLPDAVIRTMTNG